MNTPCHSFQCHRHNQTITGWPLPDCNMQGAADTSFRLSELLMLRGADPSVLYKKPSIESPTIQPSMMCAVYSTLMQHAHKHCDSACSMQLTLISKVLFLGCTRIAPQ